ncbi:MAG TPA: response regulator [Polyangiaceae bacterium]|jgi:two-component system, chemotaxis family, chemotaxis protein CheY
MTDVLVVDDSLVARKLLIRALPSDWSVTLTQAANGLQALTEYRRTRHPIMFLDLNMPECDGYEVLQALHDEGITPTVIVLSGDIQPHAQERVFKLGARAFVRKPATPEVIAKVLHEVGVR